MTKNGFLQGTSLGERLRRLDWRREVERAAAGGTAFLLGRAQLFGAFAPFGVAFAAAAPVSGAGEMIALCAGLGYLSRGDVFEAFKYLAALALLRAALRLFRGFTFGESTWFRMLAAFLSLGCVGFVYAFDRGPDAVKVALWFVECFSAAAFTFFDGVALAPWRESSDGSFGRLSHTVSILLLAASLAIGLYAPFLFGVLSPGRLGAVLLVMLAVRKGGLGVGAAVGTVMGAAMDLAGGTPGVFTLGYALSAAISGIFRRNGRLVWLMSFTAASALAAVWSWGNYPGPDAVVECFAGSVIFFLLPDRLLARLGSIFPMQSSGYGFLRAREYTRRRLELAEEGLDALAGLTEVPPAPAPGEDTARLFDRATEEVCRSCPRRDICWREEKTRTLAAFETIRLGLAREGRAEEKQLSAFCDRAGWLTSALNGQSRLQRLRRDYSRRLRDTGGAALSQLHELGALLATMRGWVEGELTVDTGREKRLAKYLQSLGVDASAAIFRVRGRRLRVELRGEELRSLTAGERWLERLSREMGLRLTVAEEEAGKLVLTETPPLALRFATAGAARDLGEISGDTTLSFQTDEGMAYAILSDGMGSGAEAREISEALTRALSALLSAGLPPERALRLSEQSLTVKNELSLASATVDLLAADAFTGAATL
ncbi:MAG: hypothetical protein ACSW8F_00960, partial [bacterium]